MICLQGDKVRLRALEPGDVDLLYAWENDTRVWEVSETIAPYSRDILNKFIENQQYDIYRTRQLRLVICRLDSDVPVGLIDMFDFDPRNLRAAIGILICDEAERRQGYAKEAVALIEEYACGVLGLHQLYCGVRTDNEASVRLFLSCGFEQSGLWKEWSRTGSEWQDEYLFQKIFR